LNPTDAVCCELINAPASSQQRMNVEWKSSDLDDLKAAKYRLEYPSMTARISALLGKPIEIGLELLPGNWNRKVRAITQAALLKGLQFAILAKGHFRIKRLEKMYGLEAVRQKYNAMEI